MTREIKFRARIAGTNIWVEDFGFHFTSPDHIFVGESQIEKLPAETTDRCGENYGDIHYFEIDALVQYTGLKDKNGVEIYEGDIVREHSPTTKGIIGPVTYSDGGFHIPARKGQLGRALFWVTAPEVIGNIYENPELLGTNPKPGRVAQED